MKIAVFGLGYVGVVTAACFAEDGHEIVGVDPQATKVDLINAGKAPIVEEGVADLIARNVGSGRLRATGDASDALAGASMAFICVGTPSESDGGLDLRFVDKVCRQIARCLRSCDAGILLVFRSTMVPGSMRSLVLATLRAELGSPSVSGYRVVFHPEFLREGSSIRDFYDPPKIVVGEDTEGDGQRLWDLYDSRYEAPRIQCSLEVAEMVKYSDNLFHAVKITFANEIGKFCREKGVNAREVMEIFCKDVKLNISPAYLRPGFAFGGSCLPKDLRALLSAAQSQSVALPMLQAVLPSNQQQIEQVLERALATETRRVGFFGLAFKPGTDDLRESPFVELAERLLGKGKDLLFFDSHVQISRLVGGTRSFIDDRFPHLAAMLVENLSLLDDRELILLCHPPTEEQIEVWSSAGIRLIDLTGNFPVWKSKGVEWSV